MCNILTIKLSHNHKQLFSVFFQINQKMYNYYVVVSRKYILNLAKVISNLKIEMYTYKPNERVKLSFMKQAYEMKRLKYLQEWSSTH